MSMSVSVVLVRSQPSGFTMSICSVKSCRLLAGRDEWFSDDLKKLDDENVYRKLQGHWIIEMSEMIATANGNNLDGALHLFLAGKPVVFFQIQKQVVYVHVGQRGTGALPAHGEQV